MNPKKFPMPTGMLLKTDDEEKFLPFQNPTTYKDITVELKPNGEALRVYVTADTTPVQRVTLYFADPLPEKAQVLGGVWERGYGDYEWRGYVPHRVMPWYFFLQSGNKTEAFGVHTQPAAMCWWTAESTGYSVYLDVRCGGLGVCLNGRTLCAAELCRAEYEDADGFTAMGEFFSVLSPNPILPKSPVYGANNWYHAYGHATEDDVLREAKALAELTEELANRPWFIIDDCWQVDRADDYNGGPWRAGNKGFPDMSASPKSCANPAYSRASGYVYYGIAAKVFPPHGARSVTPNTSTPPCPKCSTTSRRTSAPSQAGVTSSSSTISLPTTYSAVGALKWATSSRTAVGALQTRPARRPKF